MKKTFLIVSLILLSESAYSQWYSKRYGVNDLNLLSEEQLDLALANAKFESGSGIFMVVAGGIGLFGGIYLANHAPPGDIGGALGGLLMTAISVPLEIAGWIILTTNLNRIESIKEVMRNRDLHLGLSVYQKENICSGSQTSLVPCLLLAIHF